MSLLPPQKLNADGVHAMNLTSLFTRSPSREMALTKQLYKQLLSPPRHEVLLEPGDLIYNAPWWWHEVENEDKFTVGVAVRHVPPPFSKAPSWVNHSIFTMCGVYPLGRAITYIHWLARKITRSRKPLRDILHPLNAKIMSSTYKKDE